MKKVLLTIFSFTHPLVLAQPNTKQVLIEGSGTPIVLLNGGTFDFTAYVVHSKLLSDSFTVIRMQQFNVQFANESQTLPRNYKVETESKAMLATLDSLNISAPVILVGHSYGGVIAFDFALKYPGRVRCLVLVEAPLFELAKLKKEYSGQMQQIEQLTKNFTPDANITEEMIRSFRCKMTNCDSIDIRQHPMWPKWLQQKDRLRGLSAVPAYKIDFRKLHSFDKPVLILTGTSTIPANKIIDRLLTREFSLAKAASLPGDHISIYQHPGIFVQTLKTFLNEIQVK